MRRAIYLIAAVIVLGWAAPAAADRGPGKTGSEKQGAQGMVPGKRLTLINVYLSDAVNNTKALSSLVEMTLDSSDKILVQEVHKNLDSSIDNALSHVKKMRDDDKRMGMRKAKEMEKQPVAGAITRVEELERHLIEAKASSKSLEADKMDKIDMAVDAISTHLKAAEDIFADIAKDAKFTRLDQIELGKVPVKGREELPAKDEDKPMPHPMPHPGY